jgi:hypothetical protein
VAPYLRRTGADTTLGASFPDVRKEGCGGARTRHNACAFLRRPANQAFTVYASDGTNEVALMDVTNNDQGVVDEASAFTKFFDKNYDRVILVPEGQQPSVSGKLSPN